MRIGRACFGDEASDGSLPRRPVQPAAPQMFNKKMSCCLLHPFAMGADHRCRNDPVFCRWSWRKGKVERARYSDPHVPVFKEKLLVVKPDFLKAFASDKRGHGGNEIAFQHCSMDIALKGLR